MGHLARIITTLLLTTAVIAQAPELDEAWDVIVVGGGPAGLAALSGLARVNRKALLIDSGEYRNADTRHVHDVLGFDGVTPAYFRQAARDQIAQYGTVRFTNGTVTSVKKATAPSGIGTLFTVEASLASGQEDAKSGLTAFTARKVVLGTGIVDKLPATPGFRENWARGIYWCPWCDGHEAAGQKLGIVASLPEIPGLVREVLTLNRDLIAFVNGTDTPEARARTTDEEAEAGRPADWEAFLAYHNAQLENRTLSGIRLLEGGTVDPQADPSLPSVPNRDLFSLEFVTGPPVLRNDIFTNVGNAQRSALGARAGVEVDKNGRLHVDLREGMITNVKGVYAVGDANSDDSTNVPHAMWSGKRSAVSIHVALATEEEEVLLAGKGKRQAPNERAVWERVNGEAGVDALHGGMFER